MKIIILVLFVFVLVACGGTQVTGEVKKQEEVATAYIGTPPVTTRSTVDKTSLDGYVFKWTPTQNDSTRDDDVCKFTDDVVMPEPAEDGMVDVPFNHPDIQFFGRVDCAGDKHVSFSFPAVSIKIKFTGNSLDLKLKDYVTERTPVTINFYNVIIDGQAPVVLEMFKDKEVYEIARDLSDGEHVVEIFKRGEGSHYDHINVGRGDFLGFRIGAGQKVLPLEAKANRIEFIGDSITCGYGNELATNKPDDFHFTTKNSNAYNAYGAITARLLNADLVSVCYSGRGVTRNFGGDDSPTLPGIYLDTLPDDSSSSKWNVEQWTPGILVVNLGTNDFSEGLTTSAQREEVFANYEKEYLLFLERLRGYYPEARIILTAGPMMSDYYPQGYNAWTTIRKIVTKIVKIRVDSGDKKVQKLIFNMQSAPYGEDWHPTVSTQTDMAEKLADFIVNK